MSKLFYMDKLRLQWKIFALLIGFCGLLLIILWLFQTILLDAFYRNIKLLEIKQDANTIAANIDKDDIWDVISDISKNSEISVDLLDSNGKSLIRSQAFQSVMQDRRLLDENIRLITRARDSGGEAYQYIGYPAGMPRFQGMPGRGIMPRALVYTKLISDEAGEKAAIVISAVVSPVSATVTTLRYQLYVVSVIMLVLSIALAIIMAKRISKPIEDISKSAQILSKGNYDTRFSGKGFKEIVALSDTLNAAATELGRVEGLRRELLANVSHDMRTPLALIYSYAEMMNDFPDEITPEQTKVIMYETRRLATLVNDVLDITKLESEMGRLNKTRFNLTANIGETVKRTQALLKSEGFIINFESGDDIYIFADEAKIDRAFYNLLINAVNYSGDSRVITVKQYNTGRRVRISVTDSGEGIAEEEIPFIWERYYKSGKNHMRAVIGTGLGLSIVKKAIDMHGGNYGVDSELNTGSTFWFELGIDTENIPPD